MDIEICCLFFNQLIDGYNIYKKSGSSDKLYLRVNDNWGTSARYVDTTYIGSLGHTLFEICRVIP